MLGVLALHLFVLPFFSKEGRFTARLHEIASGLLSSTRRAVRRFQGSNRGALVLMVLLVLGLMWLPYSIANGLYGGEELHLEKTLDWWTVVIAPALIGFLGVLRARSLPMSAGAVAVTIILVFLVIWPLTQALDTHLYQDVLRKEFRAYKEYMMENYPETFPDMDIPGIVNARSPFQGGIIFPSLFWLGPLVLGALAGAALRVVTMLGEESTQD